jgi:hypothetical protein
MHAPLSAYLVTFGAMLFSAGWALIFFTVYSRLDRQKDEAVPQATPRAEEHALAS